jgi:hypothetical protein
MRDEGKIWMRLAQSLESRNTRDHWRDHHRIETLRAGDAELPFDLAKVTVKIWHIARWPPGDRTGLANSGGTSPHPIVERTKRLVREPMIVLNVIEPPKRQFESKLS